MKSKKVCLFLSCILTFAACCTTVLASSAEEKEEVHVSQMICFGDSSIDTGRSAALSREVVESENPPKGAVILPNEHFFWNDHWSNGKIYNEYIAEDLGIEMVNYSVGGAFSGHGNYSAWLDDYHDTGGVAQVYDYLKDCGGKADPDALYFIVIGWNDYYKVDYTFENEEENDYITNISENTEAQEAANLVADKVGINVGEMVTTLADAGAKKFAIMKLVLGPAGINGDPMIMYNYYLNRCNEKMAAAVEKTEAESDIDVLWIDETPQTKDMAENPEKYGFADVNATYLSTDYDENGNSVFSLTYDYSPNELYYWEAHYTTVAHRYSADFMIPLIREFLAQ